MMFRIWGMVVLCLVLAIPALSGASTGAEYEPLQLVRGIRAMGLGNAFEAIADDQNAFHYNPAGLAQGKNVFFHFLIARPIISFDLTDVSTVEINDLYKAIDMLADSDDPLGNSSSELQEARELLTDRVEETIAESLSAKLDLPSIAVSVPFRINEKYKLTLGGSIYTQSSFSLRVNPRGLIWADPIKDMLDSAIVYNISTQWAWEIAEALEILVEKPPILSKLYVGMALRRIHRKVLTDENDPFTIQDILNPDGPDGIKGTDDDFAKRYFDTDTDLETAGNLIDLFNDKAEKRKGYSIDLGSILIPFDGLKLAFVMRNIASNISLGEGNRRFPRNVILSAAFKPLVVFSKPICFLDLTIAASLDRRNGDDRMSDFSASKYTDRIHLGTEAILFPGGRVSLSGRIGNNQGFLTLGTGLKLGSLYLDYVRYSDLETNWHAGSISLSMSF